jgi:hypothetical protein
MAQGLSEQVRSVAKTKYVNPAIRAGKAQFSIGVRELLGDLKAETNFPSGHIPQICSALQTSKFLRENGLEIERVDGPPSKMSHTVVVRYRVRNRPQLSGIAEPSVERETVTAEETPEEWAHRVTGKLAGLLKDELAEYGGGEAFIRWVRGYGEEDEE